MPQLAFFERHHSINDREVSFSGRLFLCLFVNTSVIVVLVNARLQGLESLQASTYQDFVTDWCVRLQGCACCHGDQGRHGGFVARARVWGACVMQVCGGGEQHHADNDAELCLAALRSGVAVRVARDQAQVLDAEQSAAAERVGSGA